MIIAENKNKRPHESPKNSPILKKVKERERGSSSPAVLDVEEFPDLQLPQQSQASQETTNHTAGKCLCGESFKSATMMDCSKCKRTWHAQCVGLKGLTKAPATKILQEEWNCPMCFRFPEPICKVLHMNNLGSPKYQNKTMAEMVSDEIYSAVPVIVTQITEAVKETIVEHKEPQKWAEVARGIVKETSHEALKESMMLVDSNLSEQRKRGKNIIIAGVPEPVIAAKSTETLEQLKELVYEKAHSVIGDLKEKDIMIVKRLGQTAGKRLILATLRNEADAEFLHNYRRGRKIDGNIWINADLTRTEREAAFMKREKHRKRKVPTPMPQSVQLASASVNTTPGQTNSNSDVSSSVNTSDSNTGSIVQSKNT